MDTSTVDTIKKQLLQLKELHESGVLGASQYDEARLPLERRLLDLVLSSTADAPTATAPAPDSTAQHKEQQEQPTQVPQTPTPKARPSAALWGGIAAATLALAAGGYWWKGSPQALQGNTTAAASPDDTAPGNAPHATDTPQIAAMVEKLAARLKEQPNDGEGWAMLGRSYNVLGRLPEAIAAYEKALALRKNDANLLADYADTLAVRNNRSLEGEPMKLVERALKLEPSNIKALALAGSYAFEKKDYTTAVRHWDKLVQTGPADNAMVQQMQGALDEARKLAGMPARTPALDTAQATKDKQQSGSAASVAGTVTLSSTLKSQVQPTDTVFIFARASEGPRMPLAILRKQVKDLPIAFTLDDSLSMAGANKLSSADKIIVGARISKSGNAMPQPGDLTGQSGTVRLGEKNLQIEIREQVKP